MYLQTRKVAMPAADPSMIEQPSTKAHPIRDVSAHII